MSPWLRSGACEQAIIALEAEARCPRGIVDRRQRAHRSSKIVTPGARSLSALSKRWVVLRWHRAFLYRRSMKLLSVACLLILVAACKEPMADNPHYKATVACTSVMKERASVPGGGTTNDAKVWCVQALERRYEAQPSAELGGLARCVLSAATSADAAKCQ